MSRIFVALFVVLVAILLAVICAASTSPLKKLKGTFIRQHRYGRSHAPMVDCSNWDGLDNCQGQQVNNPPEMEKRRWQTPPQGDPTYFKTYQSYHAISAYPRVVYNSDHNQATISVIVFLNPNSSLPQPIMFRFNGQAPTTSNTFVANPSNTNGKPVSIQVVSNDGKTVYLDLGVVDLMFNNVPVNNNNPLYMNGQKGAIVELFGWPYNDIAEECPEIAKMGYLGVKIFPPQESVLAFDQPQDNDLNPWFFIYQPVSYKLDGRSGTRDQLRNMIKTCRSVGVRVYADAVINHMNPLGNDVQYHRTGNGGWCNTWGPKTSTAGSPYYSTGFTYLLNNYTMGRPAQENPAVPYGPLDFHCQRPLNSWSSPFDLNYGWLVGLADLNTESEYVQQRIADYLTDLMGIGFSGFRVDAAKHISPDGLAMIFAKFKKNLGGVIPDDFITYLEVLIGGEKDLLMCQESSYQYTTYFTNALLKQGLSQSDVDKIKIWSSDYPKEFPICGYWILPSERYAIQNDCHDDQKPGSSSRDMGDKGSVLVIEKNIEKHREFEKQLFTRTDGNWLIRLVLSSYTLRPGTHGNDGFPDGLSDCKLCKGQFCNGCVSIPYSKAHDSNACGYTVGGWATGQYTRVHRDKSIILAMRKWMGLPTSGISNADIGLPPQCQEDNPTYI